MSIIIPAILTDHLEDFTEKLSLVDTFPDVTMVQVDVVDNKFAPNKTVDIERLPSLPLNYIFSAHLMAYHPDNYLEAVTNAGFEQVAFHWESFTSPQTMLKCFGEAKERGLSVQLAINPETEMEKILPYLKHVEAVIVMGVNPGFYGGSHHPQTAQRVAFLRLKDFYGTIMVDGGVNKKNIRNLIAAGADALVVGSAIFKTSNPKEAYLALQSEVGQN